MDVEEERKEETRKLQKMSQTLRWMDAQTRGHTTSDSATPAPGRYDKRNKGKVLDKENLKPIVFLFAAERRECRDSRSSSRSRRVGRESRAVVVLPNRPARNTMHRYGIQYAFTH